MKKKIAPVIIAIVVSLLITLWAVSGLLGTANLDGFAPMGLFFVLAGIGAIGVLIAVLVIRLKEIDQEDEGDLKKY